jgi:hypothetical protein
MWGGRAPARIWFGALKDMRQGLPTKPLPKADTNYERTEK